MAARPDQCNKLTRSDGIRDVRQCGDRAVRRSKDLGQTTNHHRSLTHPATTTNAPLPLFPLPLPASRICMRQAAARRNKVRFKTPLA